MFCNNCGKKNLNVASFCNYCGSKVMNNMLRQVSNTAPQQTVPAVDAKKARERKKGWIGALMALLLVLLVGGVFFIWNSYFRSNERGVYTDNEFMKVVSDEFYFTISDPRNIVVLDNGASFFNNIINIDAQLDVPKSEFQILAGEHNATITSYWRSERFGDEYTFTFPYAFTWDELEALVAEFEMIDIVRQASMSIPLQVYPAAEFYPDDEKWDDWEEHHYNDNNWSMKAINAPEAWYYMDKLGEEVDTVSVLVIDSNFYRSHEDLDIVFPMHQILPSRSSPRHGTHVAGTIGANFNNETGVSGVAPNSHLYGVQMLYSTWFGDGVSVIDERGIMHWIRYYVTQHDVRVINFSMYFPIIEFLASEGNYKAEVELNRLSRYFEKRFLELIEKGHPFVFVTIAGNLGGEVLVIEDGSAEFGYRFPRDDEREIATEFPGVEGIYNPFARIENPQVRDRIIVVGAVQNDRRGYDFFTFACYSQFCPTLMDVSAPGGTGGRQRYTHGVFSTLYGVSGYGRLSGTSMAAPHVSGLAAMIFGINPNLTGDQVKDIIIDSTAGRPYLMIDAGAAVRVAVESLVGSGVIGGAEEAIRDGEELEIDDLYRRALIAYREFLTTPQSMELETWWGYSFNLSWDFNTLKHAELIYFADAEIPKLLIVPPKSDDMWLTAPFVIVGYYSGQINVLYCAFIWSDGGGGASYELATTSEGNNYLISCYTGGVYGVTERNYQTLINNDFISMLESVIISEVIRCADGFFEGVELFFYVNGNLVSEAEFNNAPRAYLDIIEIRGFMPPLDVSNDIQPLVSYIDSRLEN